MFFINLRTWIFTDNACRFCILLFICLKHVFFAIKHLFEMFEYLFIIVTDAQRIRKSYLCTAGPAANVFVISVPFGEALIRAIPLNL